MRGDLLRRIRSMPSRRRRSAPVSPGPDRNGFLDTKRGHDRASPAANPGSWGISFRTPRTSQPRDPPDRCRLAASPIATGIARQATHPVPSARLTIELFGLVGVAAQFACTGQAETAFVGGRLGGKASERLPEQIGGRCGIALGEGELPEIIEHVGIELVVGILGAKVG